MLVRRTSRQEPSQRVVTHRFARIEANCLIVVLECIAVVTLALPNTTTIIVRNGIVWIEADRSAVIVQGAVEVAVFVRRPTTKVVSTRAVRVTSQIVVVIGRCLVERRYTTLLHPAIANPEPVAGHLLHDVRQWHCLGRDLAIADLDDAGFLGHEFAADPAALSIGRRGKERQKAQGTRQQSREAFVSHGVYLIAILTAEAVGRQSCWPFAKLNRVVRANMCESRMPSKRRVVLVQLPIPPAGHEPIRGNVPLAAGYLKLMARQRGLEANHDIEIFPPSAANTLSDRALVAAILARRPWLVGLTCYLWNIDRTLWIAEQIKLANPDVKVMLGGPEITADNAWVLEHEALDFAAIGEGEQTFCELLDELNRRPQVERTIDGLFARTTGTPPSVHFRRPLPRLDDISSPYLAGILDAADEEMLLLETVRGCVFKCKFCYYPKSYDSLYFLSPEKVAANLEHARRRGAREVVLLDPTLNQRRDFAELLQLLIDGNPDHQFTYFGELRAEGITPPLAQLLRDANFREVEIGLQSIDPTAQSLMDRKNNLKAFERGVKALIDVGIQVKVDLIIGLPGDTVDSVHRGLDYLCSSRLYSSMQVFNLAVLPGTAFRQESCELGLNYQPRPPYYVLGTPTLQLEDMYALMCEAQARLDIEYDPLPPPKLVFDGHRAPIELIRVDLDAEPSLESMPPVTARAQALTIWFQSRDFHRQRQRAASFVERVLDDNPFTTLQVVLEPAGDPRLLSVATLDEVARACFRRPTYLDRFYAVLPGRPKAAKRLVALAPYSRRLELTDWAREVGETATIVWRGATAQEPSLEEYEYVAV